MGWGKFTHKVRNSARKAIKKAVHKAEKITGLKGSDLGAIALSPFTAGASLAGTSAFKNMISNPMGTIEGGLTGFETAGPIGALLGAVEGGGGFDTGGTSGHSAKSEADEALKMQYEYQLKLQQQAQQWQQGMSNTAHQREVADLQNAGLNPVLSAGGTGASTGSVGAGSVGMPDKVAEKTAKMQNRIAELTFRNELANSASQREVNEAQKNELEANAWRILETTEPDIQKILAERAKLLEEAEKAKSEKELAEAQKGLAEWNSRHPVASKLLGGAPMAASVAASTILTKGVLSGRTAYQAGKLGFRPIQ